jgi:hypothetical protein
MDDRTQRLLVLVLLVVWSGRAAAEACDTPANGTEVRIVRSSGGTLTGRLVAIDSAGVSVQRSMLRRRPSYYSRADVLLIAARCGPRGRVRTVIKGAAAALAGAWFGTLPFPCDNAECRRQRTMLLASFAVGGAVVGSRRRDWQRVAWPGDPVEPPD